MLYQRLCHGFAHRFKIIVRGLGRHQILGAAVFAFVHWEMVKIGLTVAMLFAAPRLVNDLSWPAMLAGLVVTMKVYWVALGFGKVFYPVKPI